ncbi:RHS repeat-associated core domain-containing protein [Geodermatophilus sp. DF01-2]|nr:RHS repeat-associated core domain-containing protein [Geodermatophilus sp. DF01_2]
MAYYALDGLASPVALINTSGAHIASYSYDPWGQVTIDNITGNTAAAISPYRFVGGLDDRTTGWIKYGQRYYDPATGRFTQQDPLETLADPTRANRYEYTASNPTNYVDPTGRDFVGWSCASTVIGTLVTEVGAGYAILTGTLGPVGAGFALAGIGLGLLGTATGCP